MKKISVLLLIIIILTSTTTFANKLTTPYDIGGHWAEPYVMDLITKGIVSGYPDGTFKPNNEIKNVEFLSLVLKIMNISVDKAQNGESWDKPIINKVLEIGLIKSGEPMEIANNLITREQASLVIYRVMKQVEGIKEYFGEDAYALEHMLTDYDKISSKYMPGVATVFKKGIMNGSEQNKPNSRYPIRLFNPQKNLTRAEMSVIIIKLIDPTTRLTTEEVNRKEQVKLMTVIVPKESDKTVYLPFENGKPVVDKDEVIKVLKKTPYNTRRIFFEETLLWNDFINIAWPLKQTIEYKTEVAYDHYNTPIETIEKVFNVSYKDDLKKYEKELKYYFATTEDNKSFIENHIKYIKDNKIEIESFVVSDKSLFYRESWSGQRVKMRLYFRYKSSSEFITVYKGVFQDNNLLNDVKLKANQWYQVDLEGQSANYQGQGHLWGTWERGKTVYYNTWFLSDYIRVNPSN